MRNPMNRRLFLRGVGGALVAAPFLSSVAERAAKGQVAARPKQLIVMFTHYGCITTQWFPKKSHGTLTAEIQQVGDNDLVSGTGNGQKLREPFYNS